MSDYTIYPYRGIAILWYAYGQPRRYTTTWQLGETWHRGPRKRDVARAVRAAERLIDAQLRESRSVR